MTATPSLHFHEHDVSQTLHLGGPVHDQLDVEKNMLVQKAVNLVVVGKNRNSWMQSLTQGR
jgi:hypothetical protein